MSCCTPAGYGSVFGAETAERDARRYRRKGLTRTAAWLRDALLRRGVEGCSLLEVGGGIGSLQLELLEAGALRAVNVELVDAYEAAAAELAGECGLADRVDRRLGDFAREAEVVPAADIVVMHRVICCYPDADRLLAAACAHAGERLALTLPRDSWWVRLGFAAMNAWLRVRRVGFRGYVHPVDHVLAASAARGLHLSEQTCGLIWRSALLERAERQS